MGYHYLFLFSTKKCSSALPGTYLTSFNNNYFAKRKPKAIKYFINNNAINQHLDIHKNINLYDIKNPFHFTFYHHLNR